MSWDIWERWGQGYPWWPYPGYYDLGPVFIPPKLTNIGLTDRGTGLVWWLQFNPTFDANKNISGGHLVLNSAKPPGPQRVYAAYDGPYVGAYGWRLGLNNGHLIIESFPGDAGPGPFCPGLSNRTICAAMIMTSVSQPNTLNFDHLAFYAGFQTQFGEVHPWILGQTVPGVSSGEVLVP